MKSKPFLWIRNRPFLISAFVIGVLFFFSALPSINMFIYGFVEGGGIAEWVSVVFQERSLTALGNTFLLVGIRAFIGIVVGIAIAWLIARTDMPFGKTIEFSFWIAFFIPALPMTTGWIFLFDPNYGAINLLWQGLGFERALFNIYSYAGIILAHLSTSTLPVMVMLITPAFRYLSNDLEEAAQMSGANQWKALYGIAIPLIAPTLLVVLMISIIKGLETFEVELILGIPANIYVFSTLIYDHVNWSPPNFPAAAILASVFVVLMVLMIACYRRMVKSRDYTTVTGKGFNTRRVELGRWKYVAASACAALLFFFLALPVLSLVMGTFMRRFGFFHLEAPFTVSHWRNVLTNPDLGTSLVTTLQIGVSVATLGVLLYFLLAYFIQRTKLPGRTIADWLVWVPWVTSGILLGLAILRFLLSVPGLSLFYGTISALILLLIIKEMPFGTQVIKGSLFQLNHEMEEASEVAGSSRAGTLFRIVLPLIKPTIISVSVIVFVSALREISALILLTTPGTRTMSIMLLDYLGEQRVEQAAIVGVLLSMIIMVTAFLAQRFGLDVTPRK